ncbi:MAG: hypothetical protein GXP33_10965 [Spirochaetes bacterium]|nr:hypothetical protein [Spirochaetota bacterium]
MKMIDIKKWILILILFFLFLSASYAQNIKEMRFKNKSISDILLALGEVAGKSIIPDETVSGNASYYFSETDFETALRTFLKTYKLYYRSEGNIYYVSRIHSSFDGKNNLLSLDAEDVKIPVLINAISKSIGKTILFDPIPSVPLTLHIKDMKPPEVLNILVKKFSDYEVDTDGKYYYIKKIMPVSGNNKKKNNKNIIEKKGKQYSVNAEKIYFRELIDELFLDAGKEYSILLKKNPVIDKLRFKDKSFEQLLRIILEQVNADYKKVGDVFYIFEIDRRDVFKKLKSNIQIHIKYIAVKDLINLLPSQIIANKSYKINVNNNSIILNGSLEEIEPIKEFIKLIDKPVGDRGYYRFDLNYLKTREIRSLLPPEFKNTIPILIPYSNSFVMSLSKERKEILSRYLEIIDKPVPVNIVKLKYIKADDLIKKLPPSISREDIIETGDPRVIFIKGSEEKYRNILKELEVLDKPIPQVRYQFLVIRYQEGESLNWGASVESSLISSGSKNAFLGTIGQLLSLSFDIVSTFGYQFAVKLNLDLSSNKARVLADTTLNSISGQEVVFRNTETFRYRDIEIDEKGNPRPTGVIREITAGLIFSIKGWISGDEMITMDVKATVSKRGTDVNLATGSLPPTSENIINTKVRTYSGEPIVIGGLMREEKRINVQKIPLLGDIPLIGYLFQKRKESLENSELVIYIQPSVDYGERKNLSLEDRLENLYSRFLARE